MSKIEYLNCDEATRRWLAGDNLQFDIPIDEETESMVSIRESSRLNTRKWAANWYPMGNHNLGINKTGEWNRGVPWHRFGNKSHKYIYRKGKRHHNCGERSCLWCRDNFCKKVLYEAAKADFDLQENGILRKKFSQSASSAFYDYGDSPYWTREKSMKRYILKNFNKENNLTNQINNS